MRGALYVVCRPWLAQRMDVVSVAMATMRNGGVVSVHMGTNAWRTVVAVLRYERKQCVCLIDGDDPLIHRQDDADVEFRHLFS